MNTFSSDTPAASSPSHHHEGEQQEQQQHSLLIKVYSMENQELRQFYFTWSVKTLGRAPLASTEMFTQLRRRILSLFHVQQHSTDWQIQWKDEFDDLVTISTDGELWDTLQHWTTLTQTNDVVSNPTFNGQSFYLYLSKNTIPNTTSHMTPLTEPRFIDSNCQNIIIPSPSTAIMDSNYGHTHFGIYCDACQIRNIVGVRYKCLQCADYDLCAGCFSRGIHSHHEMLALNNSNSLEQHQLNYLSKKVKQFRVHNRSIASKNFTKSSSWHPYYHHPAAPRRDTITPTAPPPPMPAVSHQTRVCHKCRVKVEQQQQQQNISSNTKVQETGRCPDISKNDAVTSSTSADDALLTCLSALSELGFNQPDALLQNLVIEKQGNLNDILDVYLLQTKA